MNHIFFQSVLNSLDEQVVIIDKDACIVFVNESWKTFGIENGADPKQKWIGINYVDVCKKSSLLGDINALSALNGIASVLSGEKSFFIHEYPCHSPHTKRWYILRISPVKDYDSNAFVLTHQNITQRKLAEQMVEYLSLHDPLTNLSNRRCFDNSYSVEWRRCHRDKLPICVLMIDLDRFKTYNDEKGHLEGDNYLKAVSHIIRTHAARATDIAARFGGDEFVIVLGDTTMEKGLFLANVILKDIRHLRMSLSSGAIISASIGLICRIPGEGDCLNELVMIALADAALYKAKQNGRNRVEFV